MRVCRRQGQLHSVSFPLYASAYLILPTLDSNVYKYTSPGFARARQPWPTFLSPSSFACFSILAQPTRRRQPEPTRRRRQIRAFPFLLPPTHFRRSYRPSLYCTAPVSQYSNLAPYLTRLRMYLNNGSCSCGVQSHARPSAPIRPLEFSPCVIPSFSPILRDRRSRAFFSLAVAPHPT
jgi:hypothetical protein